MPNRTSAPRPPRAPLSTYRVQFNLNFGFADAAEIVPYLDDLGVSDLYASPYLQARPGSLHGYDISDHNRLNPDLGGEEDHARLTAALRERGMGHLLDIVPNHMGIGETSNRWWMDVLENGRSSAYAPFFDIDWNPLHPELTGKVLLPVLGDQFGKILENGELRLYFEEGRFRIAYHDQVFPISPRSSSLVLRAILAEMAGAPEADEDNLVELESIVTALEHLPTRDKSDPRSIAERRRESLVSRRRLLALQEGSAAFRAALGHALARYNGCPGDPHSFDELERVLDDQAYRLAYWRVAAEEINYRRFFDINDLAGIRVEKDDVFDATHRLILRLLAEQKVTSLRIDHPDGLFDPESYLRRLQEQASRHAGEGPVYILVEKILTEEEPLPASWPVAGSVGYEFMTRVSGLFVAVDNAAAMTRVYHEFIDATMDFARLVYEKKKIILRVALASELNVLAYLLHRISEKNRRFRDFTLGSLTEALRETIACFPVYRTYVDAFRGRVDPSDVENVDRAVRGAIRRNRAMSPTIFEFIRNILMLKWPDELDEDARDEHALFVMKFQQLTGPVMAKGVEDTSFYIYNRLVSLNEVGGEPEQFGVAPERLHTWIAERSASWPLAMNSSTTHDTKRSEDVRARINVLSEMPEEWRERVHRWAQINRYTKAIVDGDPVPEANDEYLLYQTLVGTLPLRMEDDDALVSYRDRIQQYMEKATREAKLHTSWINPNEDFDSALRGFIASVLDSSFERSADFLADLRSFASEIARYGMLNSLAQTVLKLAAPGVPDVYQGQEVWDFSLVDPDNRREVDFRARRRMLGALRSRSKTRDPREIATELLESWEDGRIKMYVTHLTLALRRRMPELLRDGEYLPLPAEGSAADHLFAFARAEGEHCVVVAVPRLSRTLEKATGARVVDPAAWRDTRVKLPEAVAGKPLRNVFTGDSFTGDSLRAGALFAEFPVALLEPEGL
jgi:(1->4)-alpha-D-glucan 1-alpha-D-glucosylmutase